MGQPPNDLCAGMSPEARLSFLRDGVDEAVAQLYAGSLPMREAEALAREVNRVRAEIVELERVGRAAQTPWVRRA